MKKQIRNNLIAAGGLIVAIIGVFLFINYANQNATENYYSDEIKAKAAEVMPDFVRATAEAEYNANLSRSIDLQSNLNDIEKMTGTKIDAEEVYGDDIEEDFGDMIESYAYDITADSGDPESVKESMLKDIEDEHIQVMIDDPSK